MHINTHTRIHIMVINSIYFENYNVIEKIIMLLNEMKLRHKLNMTKLKSYSHLTK